MAAAGDLRPELAQAALTHLNTPTDNSSPTARTAPTHTMSNSPKHTQRPYR